MHVEGPLKGYLLPLPRLSQELKDSEDLLKIRGTLIGGPHNKDYSILGSILGSPLFWENIQLPC